jgi:hypothetical protein
LGRLVSPRRISLAGTQASHARPWITQRSRRQNLLVADVLPDFLTESILSLSLLPAFRILW